MSRRPLLCILLATAALLLRAGSATAGSFFVDANSPAGDCSQATPCPTIGTAVSALRAIATDGYRNVSKERRASFTVVSR